jgi:dihydropteroate synthase
MEPYAEMADIQVGDHYPVRLMGIINVSPESFFKRSER